MGFMHPADALQLKHHPGTPPIHPHIPVIRPDDAYSGHMYLQGGRRKAHVIFKNVSLSPRLSLHISKGYGKARPTSTI
jgi:hypothetical protein